MVGGELVVLLLVDGGLKGAILLCHMAATMLFVVQPQVMFVNDNTMLVRPVACFLSAPINECFQLCIVAAVEVASQPNPQISTTPSADGLYGFVGKQVWLLVHLYLFVLITVVAVKTTACSHPDKTVLVLGDAAYLVGVHHVVDRQLKGYKLGISIQHDSPK